MALEEHFSNGRASPEVAVDLEGRVGAEEVWKGGFGEEKLEVPEGFSSIIQTGLEHGDPCPAPSGMGTPVGETVQDGLLGRFHEFGLMVPAKLEARMHAVEMGNVTMPGIGFLVGLRPFEYPAIFPNTGLQELLACCFGFFAERGRISESICRTLHNLKQIMRDHLIHGRSHAEIGGGSVLE